MSFKRYTSIFLLVFILTFTQGVFAQVDLRLLENSPTPTPLPEGQEYVLEIEQITQSEDTLLLRLSASEQATFEEQGFVITGTRPGVTLSLSKTQLSFDTFEAETPQTDDLKMTIQMHDMHGHQILLGSDETADGSMPRPEYSIQGEGEYHQVETALTPILNTGRSREQESIRMTWRIVPTKSTDEIYSHDVAVLLLPY